MRPVVKFLGNDLVERIIAEAREVALDLVDHRAGATSMVRNPDAFDCDYCHKTSLPEAAGIEIPADTENPLETDSAPKFVRITNPFERVSCTSSEFIRCDWR